MISSLSVAETTDSDDLVVHGVLIDDAAYVDEEVTMNQVLRHDPAIECQPSEPQPLPARLLGEMVGVELMRMAWMARHLGVEFDVLADWDDEVCPAWPTAPSIPTHVWPYGTGDVDQTWILDYHHGLASMLARADDKMRAASMVSEAQRKCNQAIADATA